MDRARLAPSVTGPTTHRPAASVAMMVPAIRANESRRPADDQSSAFYGGAINVNRYNIWAVGASVGYNFGPAQLTVWALDEVSANASGGTPQLAPGPTITKGFTAFAQLSYRLWAPDEPVAAPKSPLYHK